MVEHLHEATDISPQLPPSHAWFMAQGERFLGARSVIRRIGVVPDDIRKYTNELMEEDADVRAMCHMALDVVKQARAGSRIMKYGVDSDLYNLEVKRLACLQLGRRAANSFKRAGY